MLASPIAFGGFIRGDSNQDELVDISDARFTLDFLFLGGADPECPSAADTNDDERIDISDAVALLEHLFLGGAPPVDPFPLEGRDPTPGLGCGDGPPELLVCQADGPAVVLSWESVSEYDGIEISRDDEVIAEIGGSATSFRDTPAVGGTHFYEVRGIIDRELTEAVDCTVSRLPNNRPPTLSLLSPAQGTRVSSDTLSIRGAVRDDTGIARIVVDGEDVTLPGRLLTSYTFTHVIDVSNDQGPKLIRVEAVDEFGRAVWQELAVGVEPVLRTTSFGDSLALSITGGSGFDEVEAIAAPFISDLPALLNDSVRGVRLLNTDIGIADITVDGDRVEISGLGFSLEPSGANGGRILLRVTASRIRFFGNGRSDFGFLGTDSWNATWTGNNITISGTIAFAPTNGGTSLRVINDGFTVGIGSSSFNVSGFLDPIGIFDALVNTISPLFQDTIENAVRTVVVDAANNEIVPLLEETFSNLRLDLELGLVALETRFDDVVESSRALSLLFDGRWDSTEGAAAGYPNYPGTFSTGAPFPNFPISGSPGHTVDATISLSSDTLNQALGKMTAQGLLTTDLGFDGVESPIPLNAGTVGTLFGNEFLALPGVDADDPLGVHVEARFPPRVLLDEGVVGETIIAIGEEWRWFKGRSAPSAAWATLRFNDANWDEGPSGFGYSSNPDELIGVATVLDDMSDGDYVSVYLRKDFEIEDPDALEGLLLRVRYDDAFVAYLNGVEVGRRNIGTAGTAPAFDDVADGAGEPRLVEIDLTQFPQAMRTGRNVLAIQAHNANPPSSDFVIVPELIEATPVPPGVLSTMPAQILVDDLVVSFVADTEADGVGEADEDGDADEVELFSYSFGLRIQTEIQLVLVDGAPTLIFETAIEDGPDPGSLPDAIVGGLGGIELGVAGEAYDVEDELLLEFAQLILAVFGTSLGEALGALELPNVPIPELSFDIDGDGSPDVNLEIVRGTFRPLDTNGDGDADWICIQSDLRSVSQ